ncbi:hypothetical protein MSG28_002639 [Choristoneura fumiferana]|uniref:Uncharacterized protein n=1 Tax=Choristoneura fumiferana TaxID=7141 RepID=A0ACC0JIS6_CHOFU|nr:hypothetical protein MSG28_002639 [Choristoneura fumiferana]
MDETVLLLRKWSISEEIIKNFLDNDISIENFKDLTDTYLKELCPHIGQRIILRNNIQDLLESVATTEALSETQFTPIMNHIRLLELTKKSQETVSQVFQFWMTSQIF